MIDFFDFIIELILWTIGVAMDIIMMLFGVITLPVWIIPYGLYKLYKRGKI